MHRTPQQEGTLNRPSGSRNVSQAYSSSPAATAPASPIAPVLKEYEAAAAPVNMTGEADALGVPVMFEIVAFVEVALAGPVRLKYPHRGMMTSKKAARRQHVVSKSIIPATYPVPPHPYSWRRFGRSNAPTPLRCPKCGRDTGSRNRRGRSRW